MGWLFETRFQCLSKRHILGNGKSPRFEFKFWGIIFFVCFEPPITHSKLQRGSQVKKHGSCIYGYLTLTNHDGTNTRNFIPAISKQTKNKYENTLFHYLFGINMPVLVVLPEIVALEFPLHVAPVLVAHDSVVKVSIWVLSEFAVSTI